MRINGKEKIKIKQKIKIVEKIENRILVNIKEICKEISSSGFYNGGWTKIVQGLDKTKTNGYSLEGEFVKNMVWIDENTPIVFCDIGGSRKNQIKFFYLN